VEELYFIRFLSVTKARRTDAQRTRHSEPPIHPSTARKEQENQRKREAKPGEQ